MNLEEFAVEFLEGSLISVEEEKISQEDSVTRDIIEYIQDCGEVIEPELSHYKVKGIKINAYDYDDDNESIDLFVTLFKGENKLQKVSDKDVEDAFSKALNFFWSARNGKLTEKISESEETVFELVQIINQTRDRVQTVRIFVLTNGMASAHIIPPAKEENGVYIEFQLWDIERVYQQYLIRAGKQKIEINFSEDYNCRLKCLPQENLSESVDTYLAIIPGKLLADIYGKYRQGLLEKNVRTFLQFKPGVNKGIKETIKTEPDMFFSYNNGISTTAEKIEFDFEENNQYIRKIENWQIVNGGQTTASIFATSQENNIDLSRISVQMKISVVKQRESMDEIVSKISRFANSQTAIKGSDFDSNSPYHQAVQTLSRSEWVPTKTGGKATNKWFYERTRGQYLDDRSKKPTLSEIKKFDIEYPKKQKFTKTDLSKYEMSWWQRPFDVSRGAEKNYKTFMKELITDKTEITKKYYYRLIAKGILFKEIDKIVLKRNLGGYKANMVAYLIALLSYKSNKRLNLDAIWENQTISTELHELINNMIPLVWEHINNPSKTGTNITEWCKKQECWFTLKDKQVDLGPIDSEIKKGADDYIENDLIGKQLNAEELKNVEEVSKISPETFLALSKWAKENNKLEAYQRKTAYNTGVYLKRNYQLTPKQAKAALLLLSSAKQQGFDK